MNAFKIPTTFTLLCLPVWINGQTIPWDTGLIPPPDNGKPVLNFRIQSLELSLSWTPTSEADSYRLYYAPLPYEGPGTINYVDVGTSTSLSTQLPVGAQYGIALVGLENGIEGNWSNIELVDVASEGSVINTETSYRNAKEQNRHNLSFPVLGWDFSRPDGHQQWNTVNTFAFDDFRKTGSSDLFTATIRYDYAAPYSSVLKYDEKLGHNIPVTDSLASALVFWRDNNGEWEKYFELLGCLMPRKALTVDFNNDGFKDLFLACTGWDGARPTDESLNGIWAGEPSYILKNNGDGTFDSIKLEIEGDDGSVDRYFHGASAGDINGDGFIDLFVVDVTNDWDFGGIYVLLNRGNFQFEKDETWITPETKSNISIELIDIDEDGVLELLVGGGDEAKVNQATLIYKLQQQRYELWKKIPSVAERGVVLDFVYKKELCDTCIYILRTSDLSSGTYYSAITIQKYDFASGNSEIVYDVVDDTGGKWLAWVVPVLNEDGQWSLKPYANTYNHQRAALPDVDFGK